MGGWLPAGVGPDTRVLTPGIYAPTGTWGLHPLTFGEFLGCQDVPEGMIQAFGAAPSNLTHTMLATMVAGKLLVAGFRMFNEGGLTFDGPRHLKRATCVEERAEGRTKGKCLGDTGSKEAEKFEEVGKLTLDAVTLNSDFQTPLAPLDLKMLNESASIPISQEAVSDTINPNKINSNSRDVQKLLDSAVSEGLDVLDSEGGRLPVGERTLYEIGAVPISRRSCALVSVQINSDKINWGDLRIPPHSGDPERLAELDSGRINLKGVGIPAEGPRNLRGLDSGRIDLEGVGIPAEGPRKLRRLEDSDSARRDSEGPSFPSEGWRRQSEGL
jgi:hypothetical protein